MLRTGHWRTTESSREGLKESISRWSLTVKAWRRVQMVSLPVLQWVQSSQCDQCDNLLSPKDRMGGSLLQHTSTTNKSYADWSIPAFFQSWFERIPSIQPKLICEVLFPPYIKPLPAHLQREDVEYLARKGALSVPDFDLRDELLRCYIEFVPGSLPEPDWHEVLTHVERRHATGGGLSLLLFQAIMFAGSAYIDLEYLKRAGFKTRRSARRVFFQRVRVSKMSTIGFRYRG